MVELLRNVVAFASTFIVIATLVMILLHGLISIIYHKKEMNNRQEGFVVISGLAVALLLIPFFYYPA